jgi:hypothetical protein
MKDLKNKIIGSVKNPKETIKNQAEALNSKVKSSSKILSKNFANPAKYDYLIFLFPIILVLLNFFRLPSWLIMVNSFIVFCCIGYVTFFEFRMKEKKRDNIFYTSLAVTVLFNPLIPLYIPGVLINLIAIVAIGYLAYETQMKHLGSGSESESDNNKKS